MIAPAPRRPPQLEVMPPAPAEANELQEVAP